MFPKLLKIYLFAITPCVLNFNHNMVNMQEYCRKTLALNVIWGFTAMFNIGVFGTPILFSKGTIKLSHEGLSPGSRLIIQACSGSLIQQHSEQTPEESTDPVAAAAVSRRATFI